jgi:hypothetical protein
LKVHIKREGILKHNAGTIVLVLGVSTDVVSSNLVEMSVVSSTNKTDRHDKTEILLKVALNTITLTILMCKELSTLKIRHLLWFAINLPTIPSLRGSLLYADALV